MSAEINAALEKILLEAALYKRLNQQLHCFCPMRGMKADGRLMLVGRAVYGWAHPFLASDMLIETERGKILKETILLSTGELDPIQYLHDGWGKTNYRPARSSFWSVTLEILRRFSTPEESQSVLSYLYWTNLYKLSLHPLGNPDTHLKKIQQSTAEEMLKTEIDLLEPKRILFLTGKWWATPFLTALNYIPQETNIGRHVFQTGYLVLRNGTRCSIVVANHPERKKRADVVSDIVTAFEKLSLLETECVKQAAPILVKALN